MSENVPLFLPFDRQLVARPQPGQRLIAIGLPFVADRSWRDCIDVLQPWRPDYLRLQQAGFQVFAEWTAETLYDGGLLMLDKHRRRNENRFLQLLCQVRPGGLVVIAGSKTAGAASFRKWAAKLTAVEGSMAKNHALVFWLRVPEQLDAASLAQHKNPSAIIDDRFETAPGMFSYEKADAGSALLVKHAATKLRGAVADFGAGWGYLAAHALALAQDMTRLDLYEADFNALEAARRNLAHDTRDISVQYYWQDLLTEQPERLYDTILCNPPFHQAQAADSSLGQNFIRMAARCLHPRGQLFLVANRHLPYESILNDCFHKVEILATANGFKIIAARK